MAWPTEALLDWVKLLFVSYLVIGAVVALVMWRPLKVRWVCIVEYAVLGVMLWPLLWNLVERRKTWDDKIGSP